MDTNKQQPQQQQQPQANSKETNTPQNTSSQMPQKEKGEEDEAVDRGRQAIKAGKVASGRSPEEHGENEKKDAEQWRNEG